MAIHAFMEDTLRRIGAKDFTTPRELIRDFVSLLNLLIQYPNKSWKEVAGSLTLTTANADPTAITAKDQQEADPLDRFTDFKVN
jgi:hypothetical protein